MRGFVRFRRPRCLTFETNGIKHNVKYTSFSFYTEKFQDETATFSQGYLNIYDGENLLLLGKFEEKICLKLTGHLAELEFFHKFTFTEKMFVYVNYDDIFKISMKGKAK